MHNSTTTATSTALLRRAILRHEPARHGIMQSQAHHQATGEKYRERATRPTDEQLARHIAGEITLAAPAAANGLAACIVYDIDDQAINAIPALLKAADRRGLFAWGELHEARDRGYVWLPFDRVTNAEALRQLGDDIMAEALAELASWSGMEGQPAPDIDNRTSNNAITRLPFGRHTWTGQRGEIIMADGRSARIDDDQAEALALWAERYRENPAENVPEPRRATEPAKAPTRAATSASASNAEVKAAYNQAVDVCDVLARHHGRRHSRTSWHCPGRNHKNGDSSPSLLIRPSKRPAVYGAHVVMCYSQGCEFHAAGGEVWDAFNVEMILEGRTYQEQIAHARQFLGLPERTRATESDGGDRGGSNTRRDHHEPRKAQSPRRPGPPKEDAATAAKIRQATTMRAALDTSLKNSDRATLRAILEIAGEKTWCRPSIDTLAERAGIHRRTAQEATRRLQAAGYIDIKDAANGYGGNETNRYTIRGGMVESPPEFKESSNTKTLPVQEACKGGETAPPAPATRPEAPAPAAAPAAATRPTPPAAPAPAAAAPAPAPAPAQPVQVIPRPRRKIRTLEDLADYQPPAAAPAAATRPTPPAAAAPAAAKPTTPSEPEEHHDPATGAIWYEGGAAWNPAEATISTGQGEAQPWKYNRSPREVKHSHDYAMRQRRAEAEAREEARRATAATARPTPPAAPNPEQEAIKIPVSRPTDEQADRDELAIMRDVVKRLRDAAISAKTDGHAWKIYHRERDRLSQLERRLMGRKQAAAAAQPAPKKAKKRPAGKPQQQALGLG